MTTTDNSTRRGLCAECGVAVSHNPQGGPCLACYRLGVARMVDAAPYRATVRTMLRHTTATDLAEWLGCSSQAVQDLARGRTTRVRASLAAAIDAARERPQSCGTCDDVDTALIASSDPRVIAERLGSTTGALARHLYRCGRHEQARIFAKPDTARRYEMSRT